MRIVSGLGYKPGVWAMFLVKHQWWRTKKLKTTTTRIKYFRQIHETSANLWRSFELNQELFFWWSLIEVPLMWDQLEDVGDLLNIPPLSCSDHFRWSFIFAYFTPCLLPLFTEFIFGRFIRLLRLFWWFRLGRFGGYCFDLVISFWLLRSFRFVVSGFSTYLRSRDMGRQPGGGGGGVLKLIFGGYVLVASQSPYSIIVYSVANYRSHLSHFRANM